MAGSTGAQPQGSAAAGAQSVTDPAAAAQAVAPGPGRSVAEPEPGAEQSAAAVPGQRAGVAVGPLLEPFEDVHRIAVLRGGGLGDLLFAMPAVEALAAAYPEASVSLLGMPLHDSLLRGRGTPVQEVHLLPLAEGIRPPQPGEEPDPAAARSFLARMRRRRFDLAVQLHGGGRNSNPFLLQLGARHTAGAATEDAPRLERTLSYRYYQNEVMRALEIAGLAGAPAVTLRPRLAVLPEERELARERIGQSARLLVVHPGATDPRRRWPAARFAQTVARAVLESGAHAVIVGDASERRLTSAVARQAAKLAGPRRASRILNLGGRLTPSELVGLISLASVFLGNDSGPRHLAEALGVRTVGIYWVGNLINAGPLGRQEHRVHLGWTVRCPVCGADLTQVGWTAERCAHDPSIVAEVDVADVYEDVAQLMATTPPERGR